MNHTLQVDLGSRSYPIYVGFNLLDDALWTCHLSASQVLIVSNDIVASLFLDKVRRHVAHHLPVHTCILPDGEHHKTTSQWMKIMDTLMHYTSMMCIISTNIFGWIQLLKLPRSSTSQSIIGYQTITTSHRLTMSSIRK